MSENTASAACTQAEWIAARKVGLLISTTADERALHAFAEAIRADTRDAPSLRDEFAKCAMQAAATNPVGANGFNFEQRAEWAYAQADAMLKARQL